MKRCKLMCLSLTVAFACLAAAAPAEQRPSAEADKPEATQLINLDFPGGSVADYIQTVRRAAGDVNVFVPLEAGEMPLPPMQLKRVAVPSALGLLHDYTTPISRNRTARLQFNEGAGFLESEEPVHKITAVVSQPQGRIGGPVGVTNSVWSVADILGRGVKAQDLLSAIEAALELIGGPAETQPVQLRFHEATAILIARGSPEQLSVIHEVVENVQKSSLSHLQTAQEADRIKQLQQRIRELELQNQALKGQPRSE